VGNTFGMNKSHALENLLHVVSYFLNGDSRLIFLVLLNDFFQVLVAVFEYQVLSCFAILTPTIVNVEHLHHILASFQLA